MNKRQFVFYVFECLHDSDIYDTCNSKDLAQLKTKINNEYGDHMYMGILIDESKMSRDDLKADIEGLIRNEIDPASNLNRHWKGELSQMFKTNLAQFRGFVNIDFAPKIARMQKVFYEYKFESPLNFIMIKSDFKKFYESFTQARLSMLYSLEIHKDALFTLSKQRQENEISLSKILFKNFDSQVKEMHKILHEYHTLLEHDNIDCSQHISGEEFQMRCFYRRYGAPMICLFLFFVYAYWTLARAIKSKKTAMD